MVASLTLLVAPLAARAGDEAVTIRYQWKSGTTEHFDMSQTSVSLVKSPDGANQAQTTQIHNSKVRLNIESVSDAGLADARWTVETVRIEMREVIGEPMILDSENPEHRQDPNAGPLFAMIGKTISFKVDPAGKVSDVSGVEVVLEELIARYKGEPNGEAIIDSLRQGFSDAAMTQQINQTLNILPPGPVKVGDSWEKVGEVPVPVVGLVRTTENATLVAIHEVSGARQAEIRTKSIMKPVAQAEDAPMKMGDATAEHELLFDLSTGRIDSYVIESEMMLNGKPEGGDPMVAEISTKTSLKRVK